MPCIRPGRHGDFTPLFAQLPVGLRSHTKQLRRLRALRDQLKAFGKLNSDTIFVNDRRYQHCLTLWQAILQAHGFHRGFQWWLCTHFSPVVPLRVPEYDYIVDLTNAFGDFHQQELQLFHLDHARRNRANQALDLSNGGSKTFKRVRDIAPPPLNSVAWTEKVSIKRVVWPKAGLSRLPYKGPCNLKLHTPIRFQGQEVNLLSGFRDLFECWSTCKIAFPWWPCCHARSCLGWYWRYAPTT